MQKKLAKKKVDRRNILKIGLLGITAVAAAKVTERISSAEKVAKKVLKGRRLAMVIDLRKCYGCHACSISCKSENGVVLGNFRTWVSYVETGKYPLTKRHFLPRLCNHCENPACVKVCPTGASYKREDGLVLVKKDVCIGCRYCMNACPYGVRSFIWKRGSKKEMAYPSRTFGVVDKCDMCFHRLDKGVVPSCVNTCPAKARTAGDLNDPKSEVSKLVSNNPVQTLLPELGTKPQVYYIGLDKHVAEVSIKTGKRNSPVELESVL